MKVSHWQASGQKQKKPKQSHARRKQKAKAYRRLAIALKAD
jgi:hypothetical protein